MAAHPDDLDFGAAGTTASLVANGDEVIYCLVTDGDAGGFDNTISRSRMAEIRREEQTAAARVVGVTELHFLGYPDGRVVADLELREALTRVIRCAARSGALPIAGSELRTGIYASHPDHSATGEATLSAVYPDARNEFAFTRLLSEEQLAPHSVPRLDDGRPRPRSLRRHHRPHRRQDRSVALPRVPDPGPSSMPARPYP
ncbi:MAG: PIG-L family deacetylase [Acidimicrobiales bacterium]